MAPAPSVIVGVDFGTTYSGIAWALEGSVDEVEVVKAWPAGNNKTSLKVPSVISYEENRIRWGYQVDSYNMAALRGVKLLLDETQGTKYVPSLTSKAVLGKYQKDAVQVTGDYLKRLVDHLKLVTARRFGVFSGMNLNFVLSVPAIWSDKAKDATLRAAFRAGIPATDVSLVSEPEAAALYTFRSTQPNSIAKGDAFIVCDAGGGTVDLSSYQVKCLEPLCLAEVIEGTGGIYGSMLLDQRFEEFLMDKLGDRYNLLSHRSKENTLTYWRDRVKPNFAGEFDGDFEGADYFVPIHGVPDDPAIPIEDGFMEISNDDIEGIFEPIVRGVEGLISQQVSAITKLGLSAAATTLVGGFGASEYLFRRLKKAYPTLNILQPPDAWSAVVSGAVQRGLDGNQVESRIARRRYGVVYDAKFDPTIHFNERKIWCPLQERYFASKIREAEPIKFDFSRSIPVDEADNFDRLVFRTGLRFCNDEDAPKVYNERVMKLCTLEADLNRIPRKVFEKRRNSKGVEYFYIPFKLVMTPTSASLTFELEFQGVSYGSVRSKY